MSSSHLLDSSISSRLCVTQLQAKCDQLRQKCDLYEREVDRLSMKNKRFIEEVIIGIIEQGRMLVLRHFTNLSMKFCHLVS